MPEEIGPACPPRTGARWLHRLLVVIHLIVILRAGAGVRLVCELLDLSGLSAVVGASYGSQYAVNVQVQEAVVRQAQQQRAALAAGMPPRAVAVCEDETFDPEICLVAIKPVANFIVLAHLCHPCPACRVFSMSWSFFAAGLVTTFAKPRREDR